jgi:Ser/Thr protein kinase RdoA (MazF antagonist)
MDADGLSTIHELQRQARGVGLGFVPNIVRHKDGQFIVRMEDRLWQVESWMAGECDGQQPRPKRVESACSALAQLHLSWPKVAAGPCPAIQRRLDVIAEWNVFVRLGQNAPSTPLLSPSRGRRENSGGSLPDQTALPKALVSAAYEALQRGLPELPDLLRPWQDKELERQYCLCDIWRPHVLFVGDRVSGIVDYGSVKVDHVASDLARLLGSWIGDDRQLWDAGFEAYASIKPLRAEEKALAMVLDRSGTILSIANWLLWLWRDQKAFDNPSLAAERLSWLVERAARGLTLFPQS